MHLQVPPLSQPLLLLPSQVGVHPDKCYLYEFNFLCTILEVNELTNSMGDDGYIRHCWGVGTTSGTQSTNQSNLGLI